MTILPEPKIFWVVDAPEGKGIQELTLQQGLDLPMSHPTILTMPFYTRGAATFYLNELVDYKGETLRRQPWDDEQHHFVLHTLAFVMLEEHPEPMSLNDLISPTLIQLTKNYLQKTGPHAEIMRLKTTLRTAEGFAQAATNSLESDSWEKMAEQCRQLLMLLEILTLLFDNDGVWFALSFMEKLLRFYAALSYDERDKRRLEVL